MSPGLYIQPPTFNDNAMYPPVNNQPLPQQPQVYLQPTAQQPVSDPVYFQPIAQQQPVTDPPMFQQPTVYSEYYQPQPVITQPLPQGVYPPPVQPMHFKPTPQVLSPPPILQYYWVDDNDVPQPYSVSSNKEINKAANAGLAEVTITIGKWTYYLNLQTLKQRNLETGVERDITLSSAVNSVHHPSWIPPWTPDINAEPNLYLLPLVPASQEHANICYLLNLSLKATVIKIDKIINHRLKSLYDLELQHVKKKNNNDPSIQYVRTLFHGSSENDPSLIYNGEKGFMMQYAGKGTWGRGLYFAQNASYSHTYAHRKGKVKQIFLAEVIVGDSFPSPPDATLILPPAKHKKKSSLDLASELYDSVCGQSLGSKVWTIYDNNKAYPTYLITYVFQ